MTDPAAIDQEAAAEPVQRDDGLAATDVAGEVVHAHPEPPDGADGGINSHDPAIIELRRCLAAVRALAPALIAEAGDVSIFTQARALGRDIYAALGLEPSAWCPVLSVEAAQRLVGDEWSIGKYTLAGPERKWCVEIRRDARVAIGFGPHEPSAVVEAVLSAAIGARS